MCFHTIDEKTFKESFYDDQFTFEIDEAYVSEMIKIIPEKESFFIEVIETYSPRFKIRHMSVLYLLPIYIALAEMFYFSEEIPAKVSINEGIEMAKMY
jgi:transcription termination factor NusB